VHAAVPPQTRLGELTALPRPLSWILLVLLLRGEGKRRKGKVMRRDRRKRERRGGKVRRRDREDPLDLPHPRNNFLATPLVAVGFVSTASGLSSHLH